MIKLLQLLFIPLFVAFQLNAAIKTSNVATGTWATAGTWSPSGVPATTDTVVINGTNNITVGANATCGAINITANATLTITTGFTLTVSGGGTTPITYGTFGGSGTLSAAGGTTRSISVTGDWTFNGTSTGLITLTMNGSTSETLSGKISTGTGNLTINKTGGASVTLNSAISVVAFTLTAGIFDPGTFKLTATTPTFTNTAGNTLRVGAISTTAWSDNYSFTITEPANGTIEYDAAGNQTINSVTYAGSLKLSGTGTKTAGGGLVVNGTLTVASGITLDMSSYALTGTLSTITNSGTIKTSSTVNPPLTASKTWGGLIEYATSGQYVPAGTYNNLQFDNSSGTNTAVGNLVVNGALTITGGTMNLSTFSLTGTLATITNGGIIKTSSTANPPISSGETWSGTIEYAVLGGGQYIPAGTFSNITLDNTSGSNTVLGNLTVTGTLNGLTTSGLKINTSLTITLSTSTGNQCGPISFSTTGLTLTYAGSSYLNCGTITYGSSGTTITFNAGGTIICTGNVTWPASSGSYLNVGSGTFTCTGNIGNASCSSSGISCTSGSLTFFNITLGSSTSVSCGTGKININGAFTYGSSFTFTPGTGTVNYSGAAQTVLALNNYYNLTVSGTGAKTTSGVTVNDTLTIGGDNTVSISATPSSFTTLQYKGTGNRTTTTVEFPNAFAGAGGVIIDQGAGNKITLNANKTALAGPLNIKSGTLDLSTFTANRAAGTLTLTITGTLKLGGTTGGQTGSNFPTGFTTLTMTGGTVEYSLLTGGQTIYATPAYNNLTLDNTSGSDTTGGNLTVNGILTTTASGTLNMGSNQLLGTLSSINNGGTISTTNTSSTPIPTGKTWGGTVNYSGATSQTINNGIYSTLNISNSAGVTLTGDATVNTALNFTNGKITTGANKVILDSSASITGATTGKYVYGNLVWNIPAGTPNKNFEIGDATNYAPVSVAFTNVTVAGTLTGSVTGADHSLISTSGINAAKSVNHAWTLTNSGITFNSGTATVILNWVGIPTDADAGSTPANYIVAKLDGSTWTNPTVGTKTSSSIEVTGITSFSDFQVGEAATSPADYFRSITSGNWSAALTWQSSSDSSTWVPAALAPTNLAHSITIQSPNTVTVDVDGQTASSITIESGGALTTGSNNLNVSGYWTNNQVSLTLSTGTVTFNDTTTQTIGGLAGTTFNNLTLSGSGLKTFSTTPTVNGILSMEGNATASAAPTYGGSAILQYKGSGSQTTGSELPASINNLTIYNPNGVALSGSTIVNGTFTLNSGNISLGTNNLTVSSISGGSDTSYVITNGIGTLIQNVGTSPVTFPIGFVASDFTPITFSNSGTQQNYNVRIRSVTPSLSTSGLDRQWIVKETNAGTTILSLVTLTWTATSAYTLGNPASCDMVQNITGSVDPYEAIKIGLDGTTSSVTTGSISYPLGDITTGLYITLVGQVGLVPVELSTFTSAVNGRNVNLNWETKTEKNSNKFIIERTKSDANSTSNVWESVASVKAAVLSNSTKQYSFTDKNLQAGKYQYRLKMIDNDGTFAYSKVAEAEVSLPKNFELSQNYPNPFNPTTRINYSLPNDSRVILEVYNIIGERIAQLVNEQQSAGYYVVNFGTSPNNISSGIYIYKLTAADNTGKNFSSIKKMMLLK